MKLLWRIQFTYYACKAFNNYKFLANWAFACACIEYYEDGFSAYDALCEELSYWND